MWLILYGFLCAFTDDEILAQYANATLFTCYTIGIMTYGMFIGDTNWFKSHICHTAINYYGFDSLYIIAVDRQSLPFILHHICAIYMAYQVLQGNVGDSAIMYFYCIEMSNVFINAYGYLRRIKLPVPNGLLIATAATYVPMRTIALTWTTYLVVRDNLAYKNDMYLNAVYSILLLMSYWYSYVLVKRVRRIA